MAEVFRDRVACFLLLIGDQVYADEAFQAARNEPAMGPSGIRAAYRRVYEAAWPSDPVLRVLGNYPIYMVWDDHEIANGWGSAKGSFLQRREDLPVELMHRACHR